MGVFIKNRGKRVSNKPDYGILKNDTESFTPIGEETTVHQRKSFNKPILNTSDQKLADAKQTKELLLKQVKPTKTHSDLLRIEQVVNPVIEPKKDVKKAIQIESVNVSLDRALNKNSIALSFIDLVSFKDFIKDKKIALVANSSDLLNHQNGSDIDNHDIVIRFNSFKLDSEHTGEKTTIHASIYLQDVNLDYFVPIRIIVCNNVTKWINKLKTINKYNQTFILKYNHPSILNIDYGKSLTTGLNTLITLVKLGGYAKIDLYGFTFYKDGKNSILRTDAGLASGISNVHDYEFEKEFIFDKMSEYNKDKNIITFYDNRTF
jgi:hypothetical protein